MTCYADSSSMLKLSPVLTLVVAVNHEKVLQDNLFGSPDINEFFELIEKRGYPSASKAYNSGLAEANSEIVVLAHQDVYLPAGWLTSLEKSLAQLDGLDPNWGVLGVFGTAHSSDLVGHVYSTGLGQTLGASFDRPIECRTLDELLLVIRRSSGLRFDERLPGFHLYGTDICMEAHKQGLKSYVIPAFCIHNSNGIGRLPGAFWKAYLCLRHKWWKQLPISSPCTMITKGCSPMLRSLLQGTFNTFFSRNAVGKRSADPAGLLDVLQSKRDVEA